MFGKYALPTDNVAGNSGTVTTSGGSPSDEDSEYPATNGFATSTTGHLNLPSRPAKLTTSGPGYWEKTFDSPITIKAAAVIYHSFDEGRDVTLELDGTPIAVPIPAPYSDGFPVSPWIEFDPVTVDTVRLSVNEANSRILQFGQLLLLAELRTPENDVHWGEEETEEHQRIEHMTMFGVETVYDMGGKRRAFNGEVSLRESECGDFTDLFQKARGRVQPWLLIPDAGENNAWFVRFEDPGWSRTREMIEHNIFPFRVREVARGLPFP